MKFSTFIFGYFCLNIASFILNYAGVIPVSRELYVTPLDITNTFNLAVFGTLGAAGTIFGVIAFLTRQNLLAGIALVIWAIGIIFPIVLGVVAGLPIMLAAILAPYDLTWLASTVVAFFTIQAFFYLISLSTGRDAT